jgi:hypothetical protein
MSFMSSSVGELFLFEKIHDAGLLRIVARSLDFLCCWRLHLKIECMNDFTQTVTGTGM